MRITEAVRVVSDHRTKEVVIATMSAMTEWIEVSKSDLDLCYFSPMGSASSVGLGLAIARPDLKVIALDGDGSLLMNLGSLVTIGDQAPANLIHFVFENGCYAVSGMQPLPGKGRVDFCNLARAAGIRKVYEFSSAGILAERMQETMSATGPVFVDLKVEAEPAAHMDRLATPAHRSRTTRVGWHKIHKLLTAAPDKSRT